MIQSDFNKLQESIMGEITSKVFKMFNDRSAGIPLTKCLTKSEWVTMVYMLDDVAAMSYNTAPRAALNIPTTVKCSDITITFNKMKSYVFKRR